MATAEVLATVAVEKDSGELVLITVASPSIHGCAMLMAWLLPAGKATRDPGMRRFDVTRANAGDW
jgi:hypothetical protein